MTDVTFSHNGPYMALCIGSIDVRAVLAPSSQKFPTYSPGGATLFDFVVVYDDSKLRTGVVGDDDMPVAASDFWPAA